MAPAKAALENIVKKYLANELRPKGVRVNAISPGPINTLAARGIPGFVSARQEWEKIVPLKVKEETGQEGIADAAVFLCSDLSKLITGEIIHIDAGYHIMGA